MSTNHHAVQLFMMVINFLAIIATGLVIVSAFGFEYDFTSPLPDILRQGISKVDRTYQTPIAQDAWLNTCWIVLITWQLAWSFYGMTGICRTFAGVPVYTSPDLQSIPLLLFSTLACGMSVAWFVVYDREYVTTSELFSFSVTGLVWIAFIFSLHSLQVGEYRLRKGERFRDIWLHRFLVQNGLALFGAWTYLVTVFNLATTLIYNDKIKMNKDLASLISLSLLGGQMTIYLLVDVIAIDRWTRYVFTPYVVNIVTLCACVIRSEPWESDSLVFIALACLLGFSFLSIMIKSACVAYRVIRPPSSGNGDISGDPMAPHMSEAHYLLKS